MGSGSHAGSPVCIREILPTFGWEGPGRHSDRVLVREGVRVCGSVITDCWPELLREGTRKHYSSRRPPLVDPELRCRRPKAPQWGWVRVDHSYSGNGVMFALYEWCHYVHDDALASTMAWNDAASSSDYFDIRPGSYGRQMRFP